MKLGPPQFEVEDRAVVWALVVLVVATLASRPYAVGHGTGHVGATQWWIGFVGLVTIFAIISVLLFRWHRPGR